MKELENNSLDLNNLPEDCTRDGNTQVLEGSSSSSGCRKKKSDAKEECGKVYECRFCSLKFCKSQALGGHMNRHRQERETETLNKARQLVFGNDTLAAHSALPHHHLACQSIPAGYQTATNVADQPLPIRSSMYPPPRFFSASSSSSIVQPPSPFLYPSPPRLVAYPSQYNGNQHPAASGENYSMGHMFSRSSSSHLGMPESNYTCLGAPVGEGFNAPGGGSRDRLPQGQKEGLNWVSRLDAPSINRFQDGF